jgi:hypothetical protein
MSAAIANHGKRPPVQLDAKAPAKLRQMVLWKICSRGLEIVRGHGGAMAAAALVEKLNAEPGEHLTITREILWDAAHSDLGRRVFELEGVAECFSIAARSAGPGGKGLKRASAPCAAASSPRAETITAPNRRRGSSRREVGVSTHSEEAGAASSAFELLGETNAGPAPGDPRNAAEAAAQPAAASARPGPGRPATRRELAMAITLAGGKRGKVHASLVDGDRLAFAVDGVDWQVTLQLQDLFWQAMQKTGKKHGLLPRTLKGVKPAKPKRRPDRYYAELYGVSRGRITEWRKQGHCISDPDQMGDLIFRAKSKVRER